MGALTISQLSYNNSSNTFDSVDELAAHWPLQKTCQIQLSKDYVVGVYCHILNINLYKKHRLLDRLVYEPDLLLIKCIIQDWIETYNIPTEVTTTPDERSRL